MNIDEFMAWWQLLFLGVWVVAAAWVTVWASRAILKSYSANSWDQVCAEIQVLKYNRDDDGNCLVEVRYKYSYDGDVHEGNTAFFESFDSLKETELREFEKVIASAKALVNPAMPSESVLWNYVTIMARFRLVAFACVLLAAIGFVGLRLAFGPFSGNPSSGPI